MSLTPEERRLIDTAIARGRVRRIPRGVSGLQRYRWKDGDLVAIEGGAAHAGRKRRQSRAHRGVQARRAQVRVLFDRGLTGPAIAEALGVDLRTIYNDVAKLGLRLSGRHKRHGSAGR